MVTPVPAVKHVKAAGGHIGSAAGIWGSQAKEFGKSAWKNHKLGVIGAGIGLTVLAAHLVGTSTKGPKEQELLQAREAQQGFGR